MKEDPAVSGKGPIDTLTPGELTLVTANPTAHLCRAHQEPPHRSGQREPKPLTYGFLGLYAAANPAFAE